MMNAEMWCGYGKGLELRQNMDVVEDVGEMGVAFVPMVGSEGGTELMESGYDGVEMLISVDNATQIDVLKNQLHFLQLGAIRN